MPGKAIWQMLGQTEILTPIPGTAMYVWVEEQTDEEERENPILLKARL